MTGLIVITVLWATCQAPVASLIDATIVGRLPHKSSFGRFRLWGKLGNFVSSAWVGLYVSSMGFNVSHNHHHHHYQDAI